MSRRHVLTTLEGDSLSDITSIGVADELGASSWFRPFIAKTILPGEPAVTSTAKPTATTTKSSASPLLWLALGVVALAYASRRK